MQKRKVTTSEYTLDERDAKTIKACLDYCYHRIHQHGKRVADIKEVQRLRKEFGIIEVNQYIKVDEDYCSEWNSIIHDPLMF